jgi:hypothetical protein
LNPPECRINHNIGTTRPRLDSATPRRAEADGELAAVEEKGLPFLGSAAR